MNKLHLLRTLCWLLLASSTIHQSHAQFLTVSPGSIWAGGTIHVIQKADGWTEQSTGLPYAAADAKSGVSGTYTFPQFGDGGLTIIETQYYYSDEKIYYLTGPPGTYDITAGTESVRVHIVDINAIQTTPADPIKIGDLVNFSVTTNLSDLDGTPGPPRSVGRERYPRPMSTPPALGLPAATRRCPSVRMARGQARDRWVVYTNPRS